MRPVAYPLSHPVLLLALVLVLVSVLASSARADGAFPASSQILLPADRPQQIILGTNFGLIISDDAGATWTWTCEQPQIIQGFAYMLGPSPNDRLFGPSLAGFAYSDDVSCTWTLGGATSAVVVFKDAFPDPTDPHRVLAIVTVQGDGGTTSDQVLVSVDSGVTFAQSIFTAPDGGLLLGVESARSDPMTVYAAYYTTTTTTPDLHPRLVRSGDGGQTWTTIDLEPMLGSTKVRIIAVDPADARTIYLRVVDATAERLAVSRDGGGTFAVLASVEGGTLTAFARLATGTVLLGGVIAADAVGYRSTDGGGSFQPWTGVPHLQALAERDGKLYGAAKNYTEGWAIGVSTDEGAHFQPLASYDQVKSIRACAKAACMDSCDFQAGLKIWDPSVCGETGTGGAGGSPPGKSGCGCRLGGGSGAAGSLLALGGALLAARGRRHRRRGPGAPAP
jgi:hypothetical protein